MKFSTFAKKYPVLFQEVSITFMWHVLTLGNRFWPWGWGTTRRQPTSSQLCPRPQSGKLNAVHVTVWTLLQKKKWIEELTDKEAEERNLKKKKKTLKDVNVHVSLCVCITSHYNTSYVMITTEWVVLSQWVYSCTRTWGTQRTYPPVLSQRSRL